MFWVPFNVSTRLAVVTAWTSVVSSGFPLAPVTTGAVAIAATLPAPLAGSCAHPAPTGAPGSTGALLVGAADDELGAPREPEDDDAAEEPDEDVHAASARTRPATAASPAPRGREVGCTGWRSFVVGRRLTSSPL
jgi:hypothetical protein